MGNDEIPSPEADQYRRHEAAQDAADDLGTGAVESGAQAGAQLAADEPSQRAADRPAEQTERRCAKKQREVSESNRRRDANGEQAADGANDGPGERPQIRFTERMFLHGFDVTQAGAGRKQMLVSVPRNSGCRIEARQL